MRGAWHWTDRCYNLRHRVQGLIDKELLKFEPPEENPLPSHGNDNAGPSSNAVNGQKVMFDSSQLITPRGARVRVRFEEEEASPEVAMVAHNKQKLTKERCRNIGCYLFKR